MAVLAAAPPLARGWRVALLLFAAQALALGLQAALLVHKESDLLVGITVSRTAVDAEELQAQIARDSAIGLRLAESKGIARLLPRQLQDDPRIESVQVFDREGSVQFAAGALPATAIAIDSATVAAIGRAGGGWFDADAVTSAQRLRVGRTLVDADGNAVGGVLFVLHAQRLAEDIAAARAEMLPRLALTLAGVAAALAPLLWLAAAGHPRPLTPRGRLLAVALLVSAASSLALSLQTLPSLADQIAPALEAKAERVAALLAGRVSHALALGIPFDHLAGVPAYFSETLARYPELIALRLEGPGGPFESLSPGSVGRTVAVPVIGADGVSAGLLLAGIDAGLAARELRTVAADLAIVFLVAVVLFNEALGAILSRTQGAAGALLAAGEFRPAGVEQFGLARLAVFLLILAEELTRAFLPQHIAGLARGGAMSGALAISLPISAYMASFALLTPFAGRWAARFGVGRTFAFGAALSALGFFWALAGDAAAVGGLQGRHDAGIGGSYIAFVAARCVCAAGYAIGTMAIQQHFLQGSSLTQRTRALALLVGAVQTAAICGAPVGGLLAEQFGTRSVFAAAAGLSLLALAVLRLDRPAPHRAGGLGPDGGGEPARLLPLLRQRRLLLPLFGAAVPVKLVLAGFLFYLVPVALRLEGYSPAAIGRAMMLYFVLVAACNPLASALSDRFGWQRGLVILGGAVVACVGLAGLAEGLIGGPAALFAGIAALGLGTGLSAAALQALVARDGPGAVVLLRTVERGGAVVGPLLAGSLLALWAYGGVMVAIGAVMFTATAVFVLAGGREGGRS